MAYAKALTGYSAARKTGGAYNAGGQSFYRINNGTTQDIFKGDDVKVTLGYIQRCSAVGDFALGVFDGCEYIDPISKRPVYSEFWSSATSAGGDGIVQAAVLDDPGQTFYIQADASVTVQDVGYNFDLTIGAGSTNTGRSGFGLKATSRATTIKRCRLIGIKKVPGNAFGDANPIVEVKIIAHANARLSAGV